MYTVVDDPTVCTPPVERLIYVIHGFCDGITTKWNRWWGESLEERPEARILTDLVSPHTRDVEVAPHRWAGGRAWL